MENIITEKQQYMDQMRVALYKAETITEAASRTLIDQQHKDPDDVDGGTMTMVIHDYIDQALKLLDKVELCRNE